MNQKELFWVEDFFSLFNRVDILPSNKDNINEKSNSLTRLVIIVSLILSFISNKKIGLFVFLFGILLVYVEHKKQKNLTKLESIDEEDPTTTDEFKKFIKADCIINVTNAPTPEDAMVEYHRQRTIHEEGLIKNFKEKLNSRAINLSKTY